MSKKAITTAGKLVSSLVPKNLDLKVKKNGNLVDFSLYNGPVGPNTYRGSIDYDLKKNRFINPEGFFTAIMNTLNKAMITEETIIEAKVTGNFKDEAEWIARSIKDNWGMKVLIKYDKKYDIYEFQIKTKGADVLLGSMTASKGNESFSNRIGCFAKGVDKKPEAFIKLIENARKDWLKARGM